MKRDCFTIIFPHPSNLPIKHNIPKFNILFLFNNFTQFFPSQTSTLKKETYILQCIRNKISSWVVSKNIKIDTFRFPEEKDICTACREIRLSIIMTKYNTHLLQLEFHQYFIFFIWHYLRRQI